ncbi:MAG: hypothetical protein IKP47_08235 [Ruminococcus sp.]|nr:hypothetical protein [Ruminococcus sp.]
MKDFRRAMKLSLIYGLIGAVAAPLIYECYANISKVFALLLLAAFAVISGIKLSSLSPKAAITAGCAQLAYMTGFGLIAYIVIHPAAVNILSKNSKYFYLTLSEQAMFVLRAVLIMLLLFAVCAARWGLTAAAARIRSNRERVGRYIENAFDDAEDGRR